MFPAVAGPRNTQAGASEPGVTAITALVATRHDPGRDDGLDLQLAAKHGMLMSGADLDEDRVGGAKLGLSTPALPGLDRNVRRLRRWCEERRESEQQKDMRSAGSAMQRAGGRR
ncbi:hypothetical protein GCM10027564_31510 [Luteimonas notoginsengisoli]